MEEFLNHCFEVEKKFNSQIPEDIKMALKELDDSTKTKFSNNRTQKQNMLYSLKKYLEFPIFGYNTGNLENLNHRNESSTYIQVDSISK